MKNKIFSITVISLMMITNLFAQEEKQVRIHELGLTFANLDNFGIRYKTGNKKTLLRMTLLAMNLNSNNSWGEEKDSTSHHTNGYGTGFRFGFEKPISLVKNFNLFYGLDLIGDYDFQKSKSEWPDSHLENSYWAVSTGIAFVFGACYDFTEHFRVSAEISPSVWYTYQNTKSSTNELPEVKTQSSNVAFGLSNYGASITVAYRFNK